MLQHLLLCLMIMGTTYARYPLLICGIFSLTTKILPVQPDAMQLYSLRTENLRLIYYDKGHAYVVPHLARSFENSLRFHRNLFNYTPTEEVTILLHDFNDYGTGGTNTIPWNYMSIGIEPFEYVYETSPTNERMNWVMNHELVHVLATDKATKTDNVFRYLLGGKVSPIAEDPISMFYSYLTTPRWYSPRWYHEGIAVFMETWMAGGIGRVLGGYDEMVFRTMVHDSSYFYDSIGLESEGTTIDFQIGANSYLYGTRFVSYLAYHYGPERLLEWFNRTEDSKRYFASQFRKVYGVSLDHEWSRWTRWEHQWQQVNLDSIRKNRVTPYRQISQRPLGSISRAYYDPEQREIYAGINYPGQLAHIAAINIDTGTMRKICDMPTPALYYVSSLAYDQSSQSLFFTTDNSRRWRDINVVDVKTGESKLLLKNVRTGNLAFNRMDKSVWGVRHHNGISTLVRSPRPYKDVYEVLALDYGYDIFDIDISPDGLYLTASFIEISGRQRLIKMEVSSLLEGNSSFEVLFELEDNSPENFVFSRDGKYLYGTSYYSGVSNVYRYDFRENGMEIITNCETGFFRPLPVSDDSLIVFRYTGEGFVPVMISNEPPDHVSATRYLGQQIVEKHPVVKAWLLNPPSPSLINIDSLTIQSGDYDGLQNVKLASAYPVIEGFKDFIALGVRLNSFDPLGIYGADLTVSYSPAKVLSESERMHFKFSYRHHPWEISTAYNGTDFYDLFGPTKTSRKGYSLGVQYNDYLIDERPKTMEYTIRVAGYGGLERLPDFQNIAVSFDRFLTFGAKLNYKYLRRSLGAVDYEKGISWQLISSNNYVNAKHFPRIFTNLHYGFPLPIDHSSIWVRSSLGYSFGNRDEPFANFYFGGFGNNWVDFSEIERYREYYSFPGVELNDVGGTNYGKTLVEWTLPPIRFRRLGFPILYVRWARISLFSSGIMTNIDSEQHRRTLQNFGGQIDFRLVIFSLLRSTFSLGYAVALEKNQPFSTEFMFSLKIL